MILLEPAYKILHATGEVQAADHLSNADLQELTARSRDLSRLTEVPRTRILLTPEAGRRMRMRWLGAAAVCMAMTVGTGAQEQVEGSPEPYAHLSNGGLNHSLSAFVVRGQPFSAQQVAKTGKTLQDGTNIEHFGHHAIYRDSEGRVQVEQPCGCAPDHAQKVEIYVMDPVTDTMTTWRQGGNEPKVAMVTKWEAKTPE